MAMDEYGVPVQVVQMERVWIHQLKAYRALGWKVKRFPGWRGLLGLHVASRNVSVKGPPLGLLMGLKESMKASSFSFPMELTEKDLFNRLKKVRGAND